MHDEIRIIRWVAVVSLAILHSSGPGLSAAMASWRSYDETVASTTYVFQPYQSNNAGLNSTGIDGGDLDQDGDADLVISNRDTDNVSVLLNNGDGTFQPQMTFPVSGEPRYVVLADVDRDCDLDLATVDRDGNGVTILLNDGAGQFSFHQKIDLFRPTWLLAADLDGDGDPDIMATEWDAAEASPSSAPGLLTILTNFGDGTFVRGDSHPVGFNPRGGAIGDFTGNGAWDVVINNLSSDDVHVLLNDGTGGLTVQIPLSTSIGPRYITTDDFDGNGTVDMAVAHKDSTQLWIYRNDGAGSFTNGEADRYVTLSRSHAVSSDDLDQDGDKDIVLSHLGTTWISIYDNDGTGMFTAQELFTPTNVAHLITVDLDKDGDFDIATANINGTARIHLNDTLQKNEPFCGADLDASGAVGVFDLLEVLSGWGACCHAVPGPCGGDLDLNGAVNVTDLLLLLGAWGDCP